MISLLLSLPLSLGSLSTHTQSLNFQQISPHLSLSLSLHRSLSLFLSLFTSLNQWRRSVRTNSPRWDEGKAPDSPAVVAGIEKYHRSCQSFFPPFLSPPASTGLSETTVGLSVSGRTIRHRSGAVKWPDKGGDDRSWRWGRMCRGKVLGFLPISSRP